MIYSDIQNQLQLLIKTSAPPLLEVADHVMSSPQWTPGQQIPAHVLSSLPNGRFQVQVGDQMLDLNLPHNTQPGETVQLTYVSNSPRLTFALLRDVASSASPNEAVALSSTAKFIGNLMQGQMARPAPGGAAGEITMPLVLAAAPAETVAFAQALRASVSQSGLFYEAHQVEWLNGERSQASLRMEPQGQLAPLLQPAPSAPELPQPQPLTQLELVSIEQVLFQPVSPQQQPEPAQMQASGSAQQLPEAMPLHSTEPFQQPSLLPQLSSQHPLDSAAQSHTDIFTAATLLPSSLHAMGIPGRLSTVEGGVHPQAVPLVQQQLQTLDSRQVTWQGQVWPGQVMHWTINEDQSRHGQSGQGEDTAASWHTRLSLQLPNLGGVSAKLAFVNGAVQLDISAKNSISVAMMRQRQTDLAERFAGSGLQLSGVTITRG